MKKIGFIRFIVMVPFLAVSLGSNAQSRKGRGPVDPVRTGTVTINAGIGVGSDYQGDYYNSPFGTKIVAEWGLWQAGPGVITLGGELGGSFSSGGYYYNYAVRTEVLAARCAWHYGWKVPRLDTYGGFSAGLGLHHFEYNNDIGYNGTEVIPVLGAFVGASYFITSKFGFNAEAGYDITDFQVGMIFKIR